jgi:hypothetical protein
MVAVVAAVFRTWCGVAVGRTLEAWSRPFGLAAPGWIIILGAVVSAMRLYPFACGLGCLDRNRRNTSP